MRSTFNILFYINRSKLKTDGTTTILCRITIDGSKVVMSTGENISPSDWSVKRQETNDKQQNLRLHSFREKIEQGYDTLLLQFGAVSAELLKNHIQISFPVGGLRIKITFDFCYERRGILRKLVQRRRRRLS